jgi:hypothetical protein
MIPIRPLSKDRIPPAGEWDTVRGRRLVEQLANAEINHGDLLRCAETIAVRVYSSRLEATVLEKAVAQLKASNHAKDKTIEALREELADYKAALGSEDKPQ